MAVTCNQGDYFVPPLFDRSKYVPHIYVRFTHDEHSFKVNKNEDFMRCKGAKIIYNIYIMYKEPKISASSVTQT